MHGPLNVKIKPHPSATVVICKSVIQRPDGGCTVLRLVTFSNQKLVIILTTGSSSPFYLLMDGDHIF